MKNMCKFFKNGFVYASAFAAMALFAGCTNDNVAGGASGDAGVVAVKDWEVAGVSQKGPFVTGSAVTVQGIDCKTLKLTDERFDGTVQSDKGDFVVEETLEFGFDRVAGEEPHAHDEELRSTHDEGR